MKKIILAALALLPFAVHASPAKLSASYDLATAPATSYATFYNPDTHTVDLMPSHSVKVAPDLAYAVAIGKNRAVFTRFYQTTTDPNPPPLRQWSTLFFYDFKAHRSAAVVDTYLTTIRGFGNIKGFDLDINAFAGVTLNSDGSLLGGFSAGRSFVLSRDGRIKGKIAAAITQGKTLGYGLEIGLSVDLN